MKTTLITLFILLSTFNVSAQGWLDDDQPDRSKMRQRVEDLRKMKLLDLLDLKDDQVEKFFAVYSKHQKRIMELRDEVQTSAKNLQSMLKKGATDAELATATAEVRKNIKQLEQSVEDRFDAIKPVLSQKQYAIYVVFESRFQEELQKLIVDRIKRKHRD